MDSENKATNPAPSLDARNITSMDGYETHSDALAGVVKVFGDTYEKVGKVAQLNADLKPLATLTENQKILKAAEIGTKYLEKSMGELLIVRANLHEKIEVTEKELSKPFSSGSSEMNGEIRAHFKSLSSSDRRAQIGVAIKEGDTTTARSIFGGPSYLSGLTKQEQEIYTREYHIKNQPKMSERLEMLQKVLAKTEHACGFLETVFEKAIGANTAKVRALRADEARVNSALNSAL